MRLLLSKFSRLRQAATLVIVASFVMSNAIAIGAAAGDIKTAVVNASAWTKYTTDLTQLGREGRLRESLSFEAETAQLIKALGNGDVRQPVLVTDDKASQETIVEQLA